jgi:hypothetical protein
MPGRQIEKGTPQARLVMAMIDAWLEEDFPRLEELMDRIGNDYGMVFWLLIVVLDGTIQGIANYAKKTFDEVLPQLLVQIALRTDDDPAADLAREALTAWCTGEEELVINQNFDEAIVNIGPRIVLEQFLEMLALISRSWANQSGVPMVDVRTGWATALGA